MAGVHVAGIDRESPTCQPTPRDQTRSSWIGGDWSRSAAEVLNVTKMTVYTLERGPVPSPRVAGLMCHEKLLVESGHQGRCS